MAKAKKTDAQREARINSIYEPWARWLGVSQQWYVRISFTSQFDPTPSGSQPLAEVTFEPPYRLAVIQFVRSGVDSSDNETLEHCIVHELVHIILHSLDGEFELLIGPTGTVRDMHRRVSESICDTFAHLLIRTLSYNRKGTPKRDK